MRRGLRAGLAVAAVLAAPGAASTPAPQWTAHGPAGGTVSTIEVDPSHPNVVYAGTHGAGVFRSADGGRTWVRSSDGLPPDTLVLQLALAASRPATVYLEAYAGQRLYRSTDGAHSWHELPAIDAGITDLDVDPSRPDTLYVTTPQGLLRSADGGATWSRLGPLQSPSRLAIAPSAPQVLYAEDGGRILRSPDGGSTWSAQSTWTETFDVFAVDPNDPSTVYVSTSDSLQRSTDGAAHWSQIRSGDFGLHVYVLAIDRHDPRRLFAGTGWTGVYRSTDAGARWTHLAGLPRERVRDLELADGVALAGLDHRGLFRNTGRGWQWSSAGLTGSNVRALAVDPRSPSTVYAGQMNAGVARSTNGGASWAPAGLDGRIVNALGVVPGSHILLAGVAGGVYRSIDGGRHWRRGRGIGNADVRAVAVAPSAPRVVYAASFERGSYRSTDGGLSWRRMGLPFLETVTSLAVDPRRANTVWAGTREDGVVRSTDGGRSWTRATGIPTTDDVLSIVVDRANPRRLYAGMEAAGVFVSDDGGATWTQSKVIPGLGERWSLALALDSRHGLLYAAQFDPNGHGGVFRSADGGRTWTDLTGSLSTTWIASLVLDPAGRMLYAGTTAYGLESGGGVFVGRVR
jgi:photosystem II stability/assembly factor-like uncharacterized protein